MGWFLSGYSVSHLQEAVMAGWVGRLPTPQMVQNLQSSFVHCSEL